MITNITDRIRLCVLLGSVSLWGYGCGQETSFGEGTSAKTKMLTDASAASQSADAVGSNAVSNDGNQSITTEDLGVNSSLANTSGVNDADVAPVIAPSVGTTTTTSGATVTPPTNNSSGNNGTGTTVPGNNNNNGSNPGSTDNSGSTTVPTVPPIFHSCSLQYKVPATANPYLAGAPKGTTITYDLSQGGGPNPYDVAPAESPVFVAPIGDCIESGNSLYFSVAGSITYTNAVKPTDANGNLSYVTSHQLGALLGKSNVTAPINSLLGVFLTDQDPRYLPAPQALNFSTQKSRDYLTLSPEIGQVFFIGTGKTSSGAYHDVVVPAGATRLFFAVMDGYQWNNNAGSLSGTIMMVNQ